MGIHWLLHSSCCFLNTNTAITGQLIRTARTQAEWWQVCGEAWVREKGSLSQVLGASGLLDFTTLRPVLAWRAFFDEPFISLIFRIISGHGKPRIRGSACLCILFEFQPMQRSVPLHAKRAKRGGTRTSLPIINLGARTHPTWKRAGT